ncbi:hypothetical protein [Crocinitomix algicola]|uniref:hypothetical protein n=1 Tax=Crocinitomix algicola TaxID=1740263 RepID=UPI000872A555|nr:hypothetical protein [Crocinitomix algicola]
MEFLNIKKSMLNSAKAKLDQHKALGQHSRLSIFQVAQLLDFVSGKSESNQIPKELFLEETFSLN